MLHYYERTLVMLGQNMISIRTLEAIATMPVVTRQNLGVLLCDSPVTLLSFPRRRESSLVRMTRELDPQSGMGYSAGRVSVSWRALRR